MASAFQNGQSGNPAYWVEFIELSLFGESKEFHWINGKAQVQVRCFSLKQKHPAATRQSRGGTGSRIPQSTPAGFCIILSKPEAKICEKQDPDLESLFYFGSSRSLCGYFLGKNMGKSRLDRCL